MQNLNKETTIRAANGRSYAALTVFAHALHFFYEHAVQELSDQSATTIVNDDIRWVITVPAIWKAPAKQFMRLAAYQVIYTGCKMRSVYISAQSVRARVESLYGSHPLNVFCAF